MTIAISGNLITADKADSAEDLFDQILEALPNGPRPMTFYKGGVEGGVTISDLIVVHPPWNLKVKASHDFYIVHSPLGGGTTVGE